MRHDERKEFGISFLIAVCIHALLFIAVPKIAKLESEKYIPTPEKEIVETNMVKLRIPKKEIPKIKKDTRPTKVVEKKKGNSDKKTNPIKALPKIEISNKTIEIKDITPRIATPKEFVKPDITNNKITIPDIIPKIDQRRLQKEKFEIREDVLQIKEPERKNDRKDFKEEMPMITDRNGVSDDKVSFNIDKKTDGDLETRTEIPKGIETISVVEGKGSAEWISGKMPKYPEKAEMEEWEGAVTLLLSISSSGTVKEVFVNQKSGFPILDYAAKREAYNWRILVKEGGMKKQGKVLITVRFKLKGR